MLVSIEAAAEKLNMDPVSVRRLIEAGDLAYVDVSRTGAKRRTIKIQDTEIARFIADRRRPPEPEPESGA